MAAIAAEETLVRNVVNRFCIVDLPTFLRVSRELCALYG
jgi:hypothetical protein